MVEVAAGEPWDSVVERAIEEEWSGIEALSGIPGSTGATPLQNVGAYGQEVAQTRRPRAPARPSGRRRSARWPPPTARSRYRSSAFRHDPRWVVLAVTFQLRLGWPGAPIRYAELARRTRRRRGRAGPGPDVRAAVLELRRSKGMVLDPSDHDTWSAGSFFLNPVLDADEAVGCRRTHRAPPSTAGSRPRRPGWSSGPASPGAGATEPVRVSTKHSLALTNRGGASTAEVARRSPGRSGQGWRPVRRPPRAGAPARRLHASSPDRSCRPPSQTSMPASSRFLTSSGAREPSTDCRARRGQLLVGAGQATRAPARTAQPAGTRTAAGRPRRAPPGRRRRAAPAAVRPPASA